MRSWDPSCCAARSDVRRYEGEICDVIRLRVEADNRDAVPIPIYQTCQRRTYDVKTRVFGQERKVDAWYHHIV